MYKYIVNWIFFLYFMYVHYIAYQLFFYPINLFLCNFIFNIFSCSSASIEWASMGRRLGAKSFLYYRDSRTRSWSFWWAAKKEKKTKIYKIALDWWIGFVARPSHLRQRKGHLHFREFATDAAPRAHRKRQSTVWILYTLVKIVVHPDPPFRPELVRLRKILLATAARVNRQDDQVLAEKGSCISFASIFIYV